MTKPESVGPRTLTEPSSGKIWRYTLTGADANIEAGKPDKPRQRTKKLKSADQAFEYVKKEEWKKLKAGYALRNPGAQSGEPLFQIYAGGDYTGAISLTQSMGDLFMTRCEGSHESVLKLASSGQLQVAAELPENRLVWKMLFSAELGRLLLNVDHSILSWDSETPKKFHTITDRRGALASCLSVGGTRLAFFDPPNVVVQDGVTGEHVFETECHPAMYGGHTPQLCAALNRDGSILAVCSQPGELVIFRVVDGQVLGTIEANFKIIDELEFDTSGELLVGLGMYGPWGPLFFNLSSMSLVDPPFDLPKLTEGATNFAMHPSRRWFAVASWDQVFVFDLAESKLLVTSRLEHLAKRSAVHFLGDQLAVRTDLGCLSVYRIQ